MRIKMNDSHKAYLTQLAKDPQPAIEIWPKYMIELYSSGYIQRIGKSMYLTEKGWEVVDCV